MTPVPADRGPGRLLDATALVLFAAYAALRLSLRGGDGAWGANLTVNLPQIDPTHHHLSLIRIIEPLSQPYDC